jgi:hypothetical protein
MPMATPAPGKSNTSCSIGAVVADEGHRQLAGPGTLKSVARYWSPKAWRPTTIGLVQPGHQARHVLADDRLAEDHAAQDVADRAVGRLPHLLEAEFLDARLVGGDGGALDADAVLLDRVGGVDGDLVVGASRFSMPRDRSSFRVDVEVGQDQLVLDELPDDPGHLVAVDSTTGFFTLILLSVQAWTSRASCAASVPASKGRGFGGLTEWTPAKPVIARD